MLIIVDNVVELEHESFPYDSIDDVEGKEKSMTL